MFRFPRDQIVKGNYHNIVLTVTLFSFICFDFSPSFPKQVVFTSTQSFVFLCTFSVFLATSRKGELSYYLSFQDSPRLFLSFSFIFFKTFLFLLPLPLPFFTHFPFSLQFVIKGRLILPFPFINIFVPRSNLNVKAERSLQKYYSTTTFSFMFLFLLEFVTSSTYLSIFTLALSFRLSFSFRQKGEEDNKGREISI